MTDFDAASAAWADVEKLRAARPLVLSVTNYVVANSTANALLALGASPIMSHAVAEMDDLAGISSAVVLNLGSLDDSYPAAMLAAGRQANAKGVPVVLDPVGMGASRLRSETALGLVENVRLAIIRGNASEIMALAGSAAAAKGVDSRHGSDEAESAAVALARRLGCAVCVSGAEDLVTDGTRLARVANGHPLMPLVTGLGCTATALCGAFAAVCPDGFQAAWTAMAVMGVAGELAAEGAAGPGSLQMRFYDALYGLDEKGFAARLRVRLA